MPLTSATTTANRAGSRHPPRRSATMVRPSMNGQAGPRAAGSPRSARRTAGSTARACRPARPPSGPGRAGRGCGTGRGRPSPAHEEDGAEPEPLGHPDRHAEEVEDGEERPHREQVADVLVGHRAQAHGGVPHERDLAQEAERVEVEVGLGVRRDHARAARPAGARRPWRPATDASADPPPAARPVAASTVAVSGRPPCRAPGGGDSGGGGHEGGPKGRRVV